jgi:hypothetical protein
MRLTLLFTLFISVNVYSQTGPGGIGNSTNNILWLKGDGGAYTDAGITQATHGQQVRQWNDYSGNNNHATQGTAGNRPLYHVNSANGQPGLYFTGDMFIDGPNLAIPASNSYSYIIVFRDTATGLGGINDGNGHFILDRTTATNNLVSLKPVTGNFYAFQKRNNAGGGLGGPLSTTAINTNTKIIGMQRNYNVNYQIYYNNVSQATLADADGPTTPPNPRIGRHATTANGGLRGYINEFIIFNQVLNSAQLTVINNYLSAKYGLTLGANDIYLQDNPGNGNYDFDVAGIGRTDASNIHNDAQGTGMVRILNPSNLGDDEFLIWGHDNGIAQSLNTTDIPVGVESRFNRVWRVNEVNSSGGAINVGDIDMRWDLNGLGAITVSDLRLLIDDNNNGIFSDDTPISGAVDLGGGIYEFQNIPGGAGGIRNNRRFTIGTANKAQTPLPITLLSFEANFNVDKVDLRWITSSEVNNDYFTIERSKDALNWEEIIRTNGAGNSNVNIEYVEADYNPYDGISYYRLKQTDFDGNFEYFNIVPVKVDLSNKIQMSLFPNPLRRGEELKINLEGIKEDVLIVIRDAKGQEFYSKAEIHYEDNQLVAIPIDVNIPAGLYIVTASSENQIYSQKLLVK